MRLADKPLTTLITGASAGLGAEFAAQLAPRSQDLVLVARRREPMLELARSLEHHPQLTCHIVEADLSALHAPADIFQAVAERGLEVDVLINNAGAAGPSLLEDDWSDLAAYHQLMMTSVQHLCHLFVPGMMQRSFGRVINVASVAGRIARTGDTDYGPSKAYLIALAEALALTGASRNVHVCALCPGFTHTEFHQREDLAQMKAATPAWIWYDAATVVREGLVAVDKGKAIKVSGRLYRVLDPLLQSVFTRKLIKRFL